MTITFFLALLSVQDVSWLTGCWELTRGKTHVVEQWTSSEGETLLGLSKTVSDGKTVDHEFLMIRKGEKGLEYVAKPSRQPEAVFTSIRVDANVVVFENPTHDFPTRITYKRQSNGGLLASIEGTMNGQQRTIEFPYRAAACGK